MPLKVENGDVMNYVILHEKTNFSANLKYSIETETKATSKAQNRHGAIFSKSITGKFGLQSHFFGDLQYHIEDGENKL